MGVPNSAVAAYDLRPFRGVAAPFAFVFDKFFRMERQFKFAEKAA